MLKDTLIQIYERDLNKMIDEIKLYKTEEDLWLLDQEIANSGGNLALHVIGNINHFFGAILGGTGFQRERDSEFSSKNVMAADIIKGLESAIQVLKDALNNLSDEDLQKDYPGQFSAGNQKTEFVVIYMLSHLNYHLGQVNYHRRLLSE